MFPTLCTSNNIERVLFCIVSMFDYHEKKSPPILRLHCVCGGMPYGSFIFQKHCGFQCLKFFCVCFKDKIFLLLTPVP